MNRFVDINVEQLRVGMFVHLKTGWLHHPFPVNSFKITHAEQLKSFAGLNLKTVQVDLARSDAQDFVFVPCDSSRTTPSLTAPSLLADSQGNETVSWRDGVLAVQAQFLGAVSVFEAVQTHLIASPQVARTLTDELVAQQVIKLAQERDISLHLLADAGGASYGIHGVNVAVLSLLLGKALGLRSEALQDLGAAALLHDIGKPALKISANVCALNEDVAAGHLRDTAYAGHVGASVTLATTMGYAPSVTTAIAQHHEWVDGSGFPLGLLAADMDIAGQILALTNNFERLCNLPDLGNEMTPHEVIASLCGRYRLRYSPVVLKAFVQTLGVYPPGSLVELSDGRLGVVVSVNTSHSLKPQVLTYDPLASQKMQRIDLAEFVGLGVRRGLTRNQVPRKILEALQPQRRLCYFFDSSAVITAGKDIS